MEPRHFLKVAGERSLEIAALSRQRDELLQQLQESRLRVNSYGFPRLEPLEGEPKLEEESISGPVPQAREKHTRRQSWNQSAQTFLHHKKKLARKNTIIDQNEWKQQVQQLFPPKRKISSNDNV